MAISKPAFPNTQPRRSSKSLPGSTFLVSQLVPVLNSTTGGVLVGTYGTGGTYAAAGRAICLVQATQPCRVHEVEVSFDAVSGTTPAMDVSVHVLEDEQLMSACAAANNIGPSTATVAGADKVGNKTTGTGKQRLLIDLGSGGHRGRNLLRGSKLVVLINGRGNTDNAASNVAISASLTSGK